MASSSLRRRKIKAQKSTKKKKVQETARESSEREPVESVGSHLRKQPCTGFVRVRVSGLESTGCVLQVCRRWCTSADAGTATPQGGGAKAKQRKVKSRKKFL
jgi:hypothetical protein